MKDYTKKFLSEIKDYDLTPSDFTDDEVEEVSKMLRSEDSSGMVEDGAEWVLMAVMRRSMAIDNYLEKQNRAKSSLSRNEYLDLIRKYEEGKL